MKSEYLVGVCNAFIKGIKIFGDNAEMLHTILSGLEYFIEIDEKANILMIESACSTRCKELEKLIDHSDETISKKAEVIVNKYHKILDMMAGEEGEDNDI